MQLAESYEAILSDQNINAVVLATPHSMHARQVIVAAAAGKHVFCEKPFTLTKKDAEAARGVLTAALEVGRILTIYLKPILPEFAARV